MPRGKRGRERKGKTEKTRRRECTSIKSEGEGRKREKKRMGKRRKERISKVKKR